MAREFSDVNSAVGVAFPQVLTGVYRHYKGGYYLILGLAHSAHDHDVYVVYVPLYAHPGAPMAVREVNDFLSIVQSDTGPVPRFRYCGQEVTGETPGGNK